MSARSILVLVIAMGAAAAGTYYVMKNPEVVQSLTSSLPTARVAEDTTTPTGSGTAPNKSSKPRKTCVARDRKLAGGRIVGGVDAKLENWPGFVTVRTTKEVANGVRKSWYFCGGVLLNNRWVLTAAHCIKQGNHKIEKVNGRWVQNGIATSEKFGSVLEVVESVKNLKEVSDDSVHEVDDVKVPDAFKSVAEGDDVALLHLARAARGPVMEIALAPLADPGGKNSKRLYVAGFGRTTPTGGTKEIPLALGRVAYAGTEILQELEMPLYKHDTCKERIKKEFGYTVTDKQICAGWDSRSDEDSCNGDSGGPLVRMGADGCPIVVGLVSYGANKCGTVDIPAVQTRTSAYADWITSIVSRQTLAAVMDDNDSVPIDGALDAIAGLSGSGGASGRSDDEPPLQIELEPKGLVQVGETRKVVVKSNSASGNVIVLDVDGEGKALAFLAPNKFDHRDNPVQISPGKSVTLGAGEIIFKACPPTGKGRVVAIVTPDATFWEKLKDRLAIQDRGAGTRGFYVESLEENGLDPNETMMKIAHQTIVEGWSFAEAEYEIAPTSDPEKLKVCGL